MKTTNKQNDFELFAEELNENKVLTDRAVLRGIIFKPEQTFKYINKTDYDKYYLLFLLIAGSYLTFFWLLYFDVFADMIIDISGIIMILFFAVLIGIILFIGYCVVLRVVGTIIKGRGYFLDILKLISYAMLPNLFGFLLLLIHYFFKEFIPVFYFTKKLSLFALITLGTITAQLWLLLWSMYLQAIALSVVNEFSKKHAFFNLIVVAIIPVLFLVGLIVFVINSNP